MLSLCSVSQNLRRATARFKNLELAIAGDG
jgi:hypothetical protein